MNSTIIKEILCIKLVTSFAKPPFWSAFVSSAKTPILGSYRINRMSVWCIGCQALCATAQGGLLIKCPVLFICVLTIWRLRGTFPQCNLLMLASCKQRSFNICSRTSPIALRSNQITAQWKVVPIFDYGLDWTPQPHWHRISGSKIIYKELGFP